MQLETRFLRLRQPVQLREPLKAPRNGKISLPVLGLHAAVFMQIGITLWQRKSKVLKNEE
jgi:hypothetical protein